MLSQCLRQNVLRVTGINLIQIKHAPWSPDLGFLHGEISAAAKGLSGVSRGDAEDRR